MRLHESINNPCLITDEKLVVGQDDISGKEDENLWCPLKKACSETKVERSLSLRQSEEASTRDQSKENTESLLVQSLVSEELPADIHYQNNKSITNESED